MRQQINLYQDVLIDKPEPLRLRQVGLIILLFLVLLTVLSVLGYVQLNNANQRLVAVQKQQTEQAVLVTTLAEQYPVRQKNALLGEELLRTEKVFTGQKQLLGFFSKRADGDNDGYLQVLDGLARQRHPGVWLRRIAIQVNGDNVALDGSSLRPELVPQYLQLLGDNKVLHGQVFSRLKLTRLQEKPGQIDFSLEALQESPQ